MDPWILRIRRAILFLRRPRDAQDAGAQTGAGIMLYLDKENAMYRPTRTLVLLVVTVAVSSGLLPLSSSSASADSGPADIWEGARLTEEEKVELVPLSRTELLGLLETPGAGRYRSEALRLLGQEPLTEEEMTRLVGIAEQSAADYVSRHSGWSRMIIEFTTSMVSFYERAATEEQKQIADTFISLMEEAIRKPDEPRLGGLAVDALGRLIWGNSTYEERLRNAREEPDCVYALGRITKIFVDCFKHDDHEVRRYAAQGLAIAVRKDPKKGPELLALLEAQCFEEEQVTGLNPVFKECLLATFDNAINDVKRYIQIANEPDPLPPTPRQ